MTPCSCGELAPHPLARKTTADGVAVELWSDGWLTSRLGTQVAKLRVKYDFDTASVWAVADVVSMLDWVELRPFVASFKRARRKVGATDATAKAEAFRAIAPPPVTPVGRVLQAVGQPVYRELVTSAGARVLLRVR
jgi:hypothetical protein